MVWLHRLPVLLWATIITLSSYSICSGNDLLQFENEARRLYSRTAQICDTSFASALIPLEDLARYIEEYTAQSSFPVSQRDYYRNHWILGDSTTYYSLQNSLIPKVGSLAYAESNYLAAAGIVAHCDLNENSISDVVHEACLTGDFDLVTKILLSIDNESMFFDALFGLDSLPEDDRYYEADWRWEEDEFGDLPAMPNFKPIVSIDQLSAIEAHGAKIVTEAGRLEFYYDMLNLYLSFNFLDSASALVTLLEPYESSFFTADDSTQGKPPEITEEFVWNVKEADWVALYGYHAELSFAYQNLGMHKELIRSTRMGIIATDRGPYRSAIPNFYNGWFDGAAERGIYVDIADLVTRFCYENRCQSRIASQEADSGRFDSALDRIQTIDDGFWKAHALKHLARRLHRAGNNAGAKEMIFLSLETSLGESPECRTVYSGRDFAISFAANDLVDIGLIDDALVTIRSIGDVSTRAEALDYAATRLRSLGNDERADSIENAIVSALSELPDSLRFGQSDWILMKSLLKSNSLHKAESLVVPGPMVPYSLLVFAYGLKGDTAGVLRTLARIDNTYQQADAIGDCLDSCAILSDTAHASLYFDVFKRTITVSEITDYLVDERMSHLRRALKAAARLGDSEFVNWVISQDQSPAVGYLATYCLAIISANSGDTTTTCARLDSAFALLRKAARDEDLRSLDFDHEATLLIQLENSACGRLAAMRRLHKLSIEKNVSAAVCRIFSGFARDGYLVVDVKEREEKQLLHEIIEIYGRWYIQR